MDKFDAYYHKYPKYPVADAGYGTYNNYLYCEEKGMEKYMKIIKLYVLIIKYLITLE